jgi:hypothetical protein
VSDIELVRRLLFDKSNDDLQLQCFAFNPNGFVTVNVVLAHGHKKVYEILMLTRTTERLRKKK